MRAFSFVVLKAAVLLLPPILLVGMTRSITAEMVEGKDPIMHPILYLGPLALFLGSGFGITCFAIVSDYQKRLDRLERDATDDAVGED